jgi:hypothetical protein
MLVLPAEIVERLGVRVRPGTVPLLGQIPLEELDLLVDQVARAAREPRVAGCTAARHPDRGVTARRTTG